LESISTKKSKVERWQAEVVVRFLSSELIPKTSEMIIGPFGIA